MSSAITDIWFRSARSLEEIADALGLVEVNYDAEDYWEWMIGTFGDVKLDVTRTHTCPPQQTDTRIFQVGRGAFGKDLIDGIVSRLSPVASAPISCGRWVYRSGNDYDVEIVQELKPTMQP
jgi:hypothetical protein